MSTESSRTSGAEDQSDLNQKYMAFGATIGSVALALQHIALEGHFPEAVAFVFSIVSVFGWIMFGVGIFRNYKLNKSAEGRAFFVRAKSDERLVSIKSRSFMFGFGTMMAVQVLLMILYVAGGPDGIHFLTIPVAATSTIAAGVTGAVLRNLSLINR